LKTLTEYQRMAAVHRPEARLAEAGVEAMRQREKLARSSFLPSLGFAVKATYGFGNRAEQVPALYYSKRLNYGSISFGLVMNWDLDFHTSTFGLRKARALRKSAQLQRDAAVQLMASEIDRTRRAVEAALEQQSIIASARDRSWSLVLDQRAKQSVGSGDFNKLRSSLRQWAEYEFKRLQAVASHNTAVARLSRAVGVSLQGVVGRARSEDRALPEAGLPSAKSPAAAPARLPGGGSTNVGTTSAAPDDEIPPPPRIGPE
jgi:outer membrane protein TolC